MDKAGVLTCFHVVGAVNLETVREVTGKVREQW